MSDKKPIVPVPEAGGGAPVRPKTKFVLVNRQAGEASKVAGMLYGRYNRASVAEARSLTKIGLVVVGYIIFQVVKNKANTS